jgi:hypothetical protein
MGFGRKGLPASYATMEFCFELVKSVNVTPFGTVDFPALYSYSVRRGRTTPLSSQGNAYRRVLTQGLMWANVEGRELSQGHVVNADGAP